MGALQDTRSNGGGGAVCSLVFGEASERAADEAFARWAYEKWKAETREFREAGDQLVILGEAFAEADAWIEDELRFWNPGCWVAIAAAFFRLCVTSCIASRAKGCVCIVRGSPRMCIRMRGSLRRRATSAMRGSRLKRGDVVDDFCAGFGGGLRYFGFIRVNRNWNFEAAAKHVQYGNHPAQLFVRSEPFGAGASGFAADVEDVGAVALHLERPGDSRFRVEMQTVAGEAVGRDVDDSHQERALAEHEGAGWQTEAEFLSGDHSLGFERFWIRALNQERY